MYQEIKTEFEGVALSLCEETIADLYHESQLTGKTIRQIYMEDASLYFDYLENELAKKGIL